MRGRWGGPVTVRVKLCGVRDEEALRVVGAVRPDAVGFVLAPSPRQVELATLERLLEWVPRGVERWAVFRDPDPAVVRSLAGLALTGVQGHAGWDGHGLPEGLAWLPVFLDGPDLVDQVRRAGFDGGIRAVSGLVGAFVVDGPRGGGAGVAADPARAEEVARLGPLVLAGGLTPSTVGDAVRRVRPYAVDVSSGIERAPGVKDEALVAAFVAAARGA